MNKLFRIVDMDGDSIIVLANDMDLALAKWRYWLEKDCDFRPEEAATEWPVSISEMEETLIP